MDPGQLSYSKISTYIQCPFRYFLKYGLAVDVPVNPYLAFGKLIHEMLDKFWDTDYKSAETFAGQFSGIWWKRAKNEMENHPPIEFHWKGQDFYFSKRGGKMLTTFFSNHIERKMQGDLPKLREYKFKLRIAKKDIVGVLDRVDEKNKDDGIKIFKTYDYKTDAHPPLDAIEANFIESFQATLYKLAFKAIFGEDTLFSFLYLETGKEFPIKFHERPEEFVIKQMDHVYNHVMRNKFGQHISNMCRANCEYFRPVCKLIGNIDPKGKLERMIDSGEIKCSQDKWIEYIKSKKQTDLFKTEPSIKTPSAEELIITPIGQYELPFSTEVQEQTQGKQLGLKIPK